MLVGLGRIGLGTFEQVAGERSEHAPVHSAAKPVRQPVVG